MYQILSVAIAITLATSLFICIRWRNLSCTGPTPLSLAAFTAILFTSGLDVGLIMFPLVEFPTYATEAAYSFTNPLAIEFGFWGFLVWAFYFLTTFYFCIVEPRVKLFEIKLIRWINNLIIIATCAFTAFLFLSYAPSYIEGISLSQQYLLVGFIILMAVFSSTDIRYVKLLSLSSSALFIVLTVVMAGSSGASASDYLGSMANLSGYFENIYRFITPISDYHGWYLFWWFAWSIMIGQFVARFVSGLKTWQLLLALLVIPSIAIALWFTTLYYYFANQIPVTDLLRWAMVSLGVIFVINSLDSLIRLYTDNLGLNVETLGRNQYMLGNWLLIVSLVLLYQFTPLKIEWVGLTVIGLYLAIYTLLFQRRKQLSVSQSG
ncbi:MAG: BCCT family transporter [Porticoccaceae bacterium]|jgi:glycine betaine transporter|nr:BCCT family transporter [Porticoccaceae bacterium]MBT5577351.1 BCCT family transporter [Porticoccaceae bacterium]MBT7375187.1 BCCT family transporter [Porticoccaceae bacterium]